MATSTIERMIEEVEALTDKADCTYCKGRKQGRIPCPAHLVEGECEIDPATGLAWCWNCDTAEVVAPTIICPCW
ncbi:hypothetical protein O7602_26620 [Micromonospora sp. WMMD1128]|uniref:hypothetical protein n=1 Tax=Micromonospora sp. WMMD1128 TaxID=3015150 RepID=UPI00248B2C88|nr:hypothetical protein [Micromonospora sp. WMMD1128]WBB73218.1 hypothetical protein O7602_26620 [Micromonospora sp. WMMD1128]